MPACFPGLQKMQAVGTVGTAAFEISASLGSEVLKAGHQQRGEVAEASFR